MTDRRRKNSDWYVAGAAVAAPDRDQHSQTQTQGETMINIPGWNPIRRVVRTTGTHVVIGVQPPKFLELPEQTLSLTTEQYKRYCMWLARGGLIQTTFPELSDSEREIIQTGLGDADFNRITKSLDDH